MPREQPRRSTLKGRTPPREPAGAASSIGRLQVPRAERARLPGRKLEGEPFVSIANDARLARDALDRRRGKRPFLPSNAHLEAAARAKPLHRALGPRARKRRQELDFPCVTLEEHLRDGRSPTEVARSEEHTS